MNCIESSKFDFVAYIRNELDENSVAEIKRHLATCPVCQDEVASLESTLKTVREACRLEPSRDFLGELMTAVAAQRASALQPAADEAAADFGEREPAQAGCHKVFVLEWPGNLTWRERLVLRVRIFLGSMPTWGLATSAHLLLFLILTLIFFGPPADDRQRDTSRLAMAPAEANEDFAVSPWAHHAGMPGEVNYERSILPQDPWQSLENDKWMKEMLRLRQDAVERDRLLKANGGDEETAKAVRAGLAWLAGSQEREGASAGSWSPSNHGAFDDSYRVASTGLATLAFLAEGNSHAAGEYKQNVAGAVAFLSRRRQHDGLLAPRNARYMYNHGIATLALLEDFCMTRDMKLAPVVEDAVNFILRAQTPAGGWGYTLAAGSCDAIVTTWQVMALRLALGLGMKEVGIALRRADAWLLCITNQKGEVGYAAINHFPNGPQTLTAMSLCAAYQMGRGGSDPVSAAGAEALSATLPGDAAFKDPMMLDLCHLWFGSLALVRTQRNGKSYWEPWNGKIKKALVALQLTGASGADSAQARAAEAAGSWPLIDRWSTFGGSVYTSSLAILTLQSYYRYPSS